MLDIEDASRDLRRYLYEDLIVSFYVCQVPHEISELAQSLSLLEAELAKPGAEETYGVIGVRVHSFQVIDEFIPLLSMHDFSDSISDLILFVDLFHGEDWVIRFRVSFRKLVLLKPMILELFDEEKGPLVEIGLFLKPLFPLFFFSHAVLLNGEGQVLAVLDIDLVEVMGEPTELRFHDAESSQVKPAV